jgi:hypothetical protein
MFQVVAAVKSGAVTVLIVCNPPCRKMLEATMICKIIIEVLESAVS